MMIAFTGELVHKFIFHKWGAVMGIEPIGWSFYVNDHTIPIRAFLFSQSLELLHNDLLRILLFKTNVRIMGPSLVHFKQRDRYGPALIGFIVLCLESFNLIVKNLKV